MTISGYERIYPTNIEQCRVRNSVNNFRAPIQLTRGPLSGEIEVIALDDMWLARRRLSQMICQFLTVPEKQFALGLATGDQPFFGPDGLAFAEGEISIAHASRAFLQIIPANVSFYSVRFTESLSKNSISPSFFRDLQSVTNDNSPQQIASKNFHRQLLKHLKAIFTLASESKNADVSSQKTDLLNTLNANISKESVVNARTNSRSRIFQRATNFIIDTPIHTVTLDRVATTCTTSRRNLEITFAERIGIPPNEFITSIRLNAARKKLLAPEINESIASIAESCGIKHLGKFAKNYSEMFGELPSATLRQSLKTRA
ncbi:helix-turn-helix domain-containing protein [Aurantivibrio plasticivorans]